MPKLPAGVPKKLAKDATRDYKERKIKKDGIDKVRKDKVGNRSENSRILTKSRLSVMKMVTDDLEMVFYQ